MAIIVVNSEQIAGITGRQEKRPPEIFQFFPTLELSSQSLVETTQVLGISLATFLAFIAVQWWAIAFPDWVKYKILCIPRATPGCTWGYSHSTPTGLCILIFF